METEKTAFENLLESFTNLLSSDDSSLDQLQEIVDFIKENRQKIENLSVEQINGLQEALDLKVNIADIIDDLTSTLADAPLSANQGRVLNEEIALLQEAIESLRVILTSDDTTLDELQEIVNFIKQNRDDLANLDLSNIAETDTLKHFSKELKDKLESIEEGANKYIHPVSHAATMIEEDTAHRFVTDTQIDTWNNKADIDTNTWRPVSDSVSSTSSSVGASSKAVKTAYDKATSAYNKANNSVVPIGFIMINPTPSIPSGFLECNGAAVSRAAYSALYSKIGTRYGSGNGSTTFNLPDLRGEFIRGYDHGRGVDSGRGLGSFQVDTFKKHSHSVYTLLGSGSGVAGSPIGQVRGNRDTTAVGGNETRPRNIAMMYCIKY
ncbi:tail fiber protein [Halarcobacter sp.]|uniref:tail fiber protein n=1 Tax=Halarcobacter sp. TaxID=2321133 RepID=UPI002AA895D1|nr:tail fiber protein [Halarcobacter sp.]